MLKKEISMKTRFWLVALCFLPACAEHASSPHERAQADCARQAKAAVHRMNAGSNDLAAETNRTLYENTKQSCLASKGYVGS